jgi:hypothetical protein
VILKHCWVKIMPAYFSDRKDIHNNEINVETVAP